MGKHEIRAASIHSVKRIPATISASTKVKPNASVRVNLKLAMLPEDLLDEVGGADEVGDEEVGDGVGEIEEVTLRDEGKDSEMPARSMISIDPDLSSNACECSKITLSGTYGTEGAVSVRVRTLGSTIRVRQAPLDV